MDWNVHCMYARGMPLPHLQFGQLDKPHADLMIDESLSSLEPKTDKESRSSLGSRHFKLVVYYYTKPYVIVSRNIGMLFVEKEPSR